MISDMNFDPTQLLPFNWTCGWIAAAAPETSLLNMLQGLHVMHKKKQNGSSLLLFFFCSSFDLQDKEIKMSEIPWQLCDLLSVFRALDFRGSPRKTRKLLGLGRNPAKSPLRFAGWSFASDPPKQPICVVFHGKLANSAS